MIHNFWKVFLVVILCCVFMVSYTSKNTDVKEEIGVINRTNRSTGSLWVPDDHIDAIVPPFIQFEKRYRYSHKHKINVCVIEKNMSTILTAIICYLYDSKKFIEKKRDINKEEFKIRLCKYKNEAESIGTIRDYKKFKNRYLHLAVSRDPIERFISGFTDKCLIEKIYRKRRGTCNNCKGNVTCFIEVEYERMMRYSVGERITSFDDQHFFPQNWRCQFSAHLTKYNIIKYSKTQDGTQEFFNELFHHFRSHNVTDEQIKFIQNQVNAGRTKHSTVDKNKSLALEKEVRSSPYLMGMLVKMYYYDFLIFGYSVPKIIM